MRRKGAVAASVRRVAELASAAALTVSPALAGDRALIDLIGYSEDGRYFAFEEFGIQDGSGFPYSTIYVLDLPADKWVSGSPFRARLEDEGNLPEARREAQRLASGTIDSLGIAQPAHYVALNGDGEPHDGTSLDYGTVGYQPGEVLDERRLVLETFPATPGIDCSILAEPPLGYALTLEAEGRTRELHRDGNKLPASRGCPTAYRLYGLVTVGDFGGPRSPVAIVSVYPFGFEGPDRRFLAVPLGSE